MTFEATLQSIDASLKALVVIAQTGASAAHTFGAPVADIVLPVVKATRKAKETAAEAPVPAEAPAAAVAPVATDPLGLVDGDPSGTRYWVIEKHSTVYAQKPGDIDCSIEGAKIESATVYLEKMAEFAKKSLVPPVKVAAVTPPAAVSAPVATASTASSAEAGPSFKEVTDKLIELSKDTRPGKGRDALVALLAKYLPNTAATDRRVPALAALNKNVELMAEVMAQLAPDTEVETDIFG